MKVPICQLPEMPFSFVFSTPAPTCTPLLPNPGKAAPKPSRYRCTASLFPIHCGSSVMKEGTSHAFTWKGIFQRLRFWLRKLLGNIKGDDVTLKSTRCNARPVAEALKPTWRGRGWGEGRKPTWPSCLELLWLYRYIRMGSLLLPFPDFSVECNINPTC